MYSLPLYVALTLTLLGGQRSSATVSKPEKPNFLMIVVDDLRVELSPYLQNTTLIKTPNVAAFAKESVLFTRAYTQQAVCSPSRNSFLSGRRPDTTQTWNFIDSFRKTPPDGHKWIALPQMFKENGYFSAGCGKVYHPGHPKNNDLPYSWSTPYWYAPPAQVGICGNYKPWCTLADEKCVDRHLADYTIANLTTFVKEKKQFFYATGFHRPHVDWGVPQKFSDMYPQPQHIALPTHKRAPTDMPPMAFWSDIWMESHGIFNGTKIRPEHPIPDYLMGEMRRAYYASVSYVDHQIGRVLEKVKELGLDNNTVILIFGDHGWQLGEHGEWCKRTNFELATRVPLLVKVPWLPESHGKKSTSLVELLDVYPTLAELAGLQVQKGVQGVSFASVLKDTTATTRTIAFSQYPRCRPKKVDNMPRTLTERLQAALVDLPNGGCIEVEKQNFEYMGVSMRTPDWRYTEWLTWNGTQLKPNWNDSRGVELYSHIDDDGTDLNRFENVNQAYDNRYKGIVEKFHDLLRKSWDRNV
eukprot:TRINITY_DN66951_c0_g1_i3.p1 TRINITY_DN66951_c0_g1~~TRINITY_DN66951_c0_g1_i3.p1  ORF type:complete len:526 (+),score=35.83 TRINITY_DN66951_c0_g1_i3:39-1616(+)